MRNAAKYFAAFCAIFFVFLCAITFGLLMPAENGYLWNYFESNPLISVIFWFAIFLPLMGCFVSIGILLKYRTDVFSKLRFPLYFLAIVYFIAWIINIIIAL